MFDEYSMTNQRELAEFTGFTEEEVQELCPQYDMSYDKMKQWYDGYDLKGIQIYNPRSVVMSLSGHDFDSYWTKTETYEALKKYIQMDMYNLKELVTRLIAGSSIEINPDKFQNDMTTFASADDVLTLLVHLGYLTYDFDNHVPFISRIRKYRRNLLIVLKMVAGNRLWTQSGNPKSCLQPQSAVRKKRLPG